MPSPSWSGLVGVIAGTLTTLSFVPQVLKSWRTGSVKDLSGAMLTTFTSGVALWIVYGVSTGARPIVAANVVTLVLALALVGMKWKFRRRDRDQPAEKREGPLA